MGIANSIPKAFRYEERAVAYIDVLGFAELVKQSESSSIAFIKVQKLLSTDDLFDRFVGEFLSSFAEAAFFSDSFVLSVASPESRLFYLIREVAYLCRYLLLQGFPCRGAIATGSLHHRGDLLLVRPWWTHIEWSRRFPSTPASFWTT